MTGAHRWRAHLTRIGAVLRVALQWLHLLARPRGGIFATAPLPRSGPWRFPPYLRRASAAGAPVLRNQTSASAPTPRSEQAPGSADSPTLPSGEFDAVQVEPTFSEAQYPAAFALLQLGPRPKLFDLRALPLIAPELFSRLSDTWSAAPTTVPRLGILLDYERWVIYSHVALRRLRPVIAKGVQVEILYEQQLDEVHRWFAAGEVRHRIPDVLLWLRREWRATMIWPAVLSTTASLIQLHAATDSAPGLLTELAEIALGFGDAEGAPKAARYARVALKWVGNAPSIARCRGLRVLACATMNQGDVHGALVLYECAIATAVILKAPAEEARALQAVAKHALRGRNAERAVTVYRRALELVANDNALDALHLRASLHHDLAAALDTLGNCDGAEAHALAAYGLHSMAASPLANDDQALLAQIRARGAAGRDDSGHGREAHATPANPGCTAIRSRQHRWRRR